jgi:hypothetical protein
MPSAVAGGDRTVVGREVTADAAALLTALFPHLARLQVSRTADTGEAVSLWASVKGAQARCPGAGRRRGCTAAASGWWRTAAGGPPLLIALSVRRFLQVLSADGTAGSRDTCR